MKFSKSTGCFYPEELQYQELPPDAVDVPVDDFDRSMGRAPGDTLDVIDGRVVVIPKRAPTLNELKAAQLVDIRNACEQEIACLQVGYPTSEVLSWSKQEAEARAFVAAPSSATPLLDALAEARGINKAELAERVIVKANTFAQYSGAAIGKRQALEDALNALPSDATAEQIAAIAW